MDIQLNLNSETVNRAEPVKPLIVEPTATVGQVLRLLKEHKTGCVLICRDQVLEGIFTERDALKLMAQRADWDTPIQQVMIRNPVTLSSTSTVGQAIGKMAAGGYRRMPIVDQQNRPLGLLKVSGILHYLVQHFPNVVYTLPPKPHYVNPQREGA